MYRGWYQISMNENNCKEICPKLNCKWKAKRFFLHKTFDHDMYNYTNYNMLGQLDNIFATTWQQILITCFIQPYNSFELWYFPYEMICEVDAGSNFLIWCRFFKYIQHISKLNANLEIPSTFISNSWVVYLDCPDLPNNIFCQMNFCQKSVIWSSILLRLSHMQYRRSQYEHRLPATTTPQLLWIFYKK